MRDLIRIKRICKLLEEKWNEAPEYRLGQFLRVFIFNFEPDDYPNMFNQEDTITEERLKNLNIELIKIKTQDPNIYVEDLKKNNYKSLKS
jgi:hypothetical protein